MTMPFAWDVEGPVQAEVFVVWLNDDVLELTGPCGPAPWLLELGATEHPVEVVDRIVRDVVGDPLLVHSTSWRRDREAVILSFVVVDRRPASWATWQPAGGPDRPRPIRGDASRPATSRPTRWSSTPCATWPGWRRMTPSSAAELSAAWKAALATYVPEPFRNLG